MMWLLLGCTPKAPVAPPEPQAEAGHISILHTNDMHSHYLPEPAEWLEGRPAIGGMERLDAEVIALRKSRMNAVLLMDAGDILTGTPLSDISVHGALGGAMVDFMQAIGYDAWALGNHEFDKGLDNLIALGQASEMPILSANVRLPDGQGMVLPHQEASHIFRVNGLRVGVVGATTSGLKGLMGPKDFERIKLLDVAQAVQAEVDVLDPQTDLVVVLSHIGVEDDRMLAATVHGVDLIVGGHSHTRIPTAEQINGVWIVQTGSYTRSLGVVDLVVSGDAISEFHYELRDLLPGTAPGPASATVTELAKKYQTEIDTIYGEVLGTSPAIMGRSYNHESAVGRWITDVLRESTQTDIGLYNGGGLRADIPAGTIKVLDIYQCFPFGNHVVTFKLTGDQVMGIVLGNMAAEAFEKRGFLSISGLSYKWRMNNGAPEASDVRIGGKPIDPKATYTLSANSYIAEQWEKHLGVPPMDLQTLTMTDFEAAVAWMRQHPEIKDPGDKRAQRLEK